MLIVKDTVVSVEVSNAVPKCMMLGNWKTRKRRNGNGNGNGKGCPKRKSIFLIGLLTTR